MATRIILTATKGDDRGRKHVFTGRTKYEIGRSEDCALRLPKTDLTASRHHCSLEIDGPHIQVRDLGSRNGTRVNGDLVGYWEPNESVEEPASEKPPSHELASGDELQIGLTVFKVEVEELADPSKNHLAMSAG